MTEDDIIQRIANLESRVDEMRIDIAVLYEMSKGIGKIEAKLDRLIEENSISILNTLKKNWPALVLLGFVIAQHLGLI